jgi:hypothetical protein
LTRCLYQHIFGLKTNPIICLAPPLPSAAERSTAGVMGGGLFQFLTDCSLTRLKKGSDEFTLAANRHFWKSFEPFAARNFRPQFQPICEEAKLIGRDLTAFDAFQ